MMRKSLKAMVLAVAVLAVATTAVAMPEPAQDVRIEAVQPTVKALSGKVEINLPGDAPRQVAIFALTGQCVRNVTVQPGVTVIELPAGYYIVKCDRLSQRVVVR